ncbi:MAG TPA: hypothetical protein PK547_00105 [Candidatus Paceibacterota bacterium]|nr:hypothetical protein [Candidatus Paceibacterota bacterium]
MKKNKILVVLIVIILLGTTGLVIVRERSSYKKSVTTANNSPSPTNNMGLPENEQGQPLYLIDGQVKQVISANPFQMIVSVRLSHIFKNPTQEAIDKEILTTKETAFLLQDLSTKTSSDLEDPNALKAGDQVAIWTKEPGSDILNLEKLTATKIIKFIN